MHTRPTALWSRVIGFARVAVGRPDRRATISKKLFWPLLSPHPIIVEAEAPVGTHRLELRQLRPDVDIHAFEPLPDVDRALVARAGHRPNDSCRLLALGGRIEPVGMLVCGGASNGSSSLLKPAGHLRGHADVSVEATASAAVTTLDDRAASYRIQRTDLIWLDMQGGELRPLEAAPRMLANACLVHMELSLVELCAGGPIYAEVQKWMEQHGFQVIHEALAWRDSGNVLFGRPASSTPSVVSEART